MTEQWQELRETIIELRDNDGTGTQQEVCKFLANYMDVLEKQIIDGWIPVSERLPEKEGNYITTVKSGGFYRVEGESIFEVYGDGITHWAVIGEVIAWMPKPEPYKSESEDSE